MNIPKSSSITNYGVFNTGEIHGNVVNSINQSFAGDQNDQTAQMKDALVTLAGEIQKNSQNLEKPDEALRRVQQTAEEVGSGSPDRGVVTSYLERIMAMAGKVPAILQAIEKVKSLFNALHGAA